MSIQPQLKTSSIYKNLLESINAGDLLIPETELYALLREARDIPLRSESLSMQGLIYIVWGKIDKGVELCEEAVSEDPYMPAIWLNYALAVGRRGKYKKQREILKRAIEYESPLSIKAVLHNALQWPNAELVMQSISMIEKLKIDINETDHRDAVNMLNMIKDDNELASSISLLVECVMDVAEKNNINYTATYIDRLVLDEEPCFVCHIGDVDAKTLFNLNNQLVKSIVDNGLAGAQALAMFERGE